jgi:hypothetical protein
MVWCLSTVMTLLLCLYCMCVKVDTALCLHFERHRKKANVITLYVVVNIACNEKEISLNHRTLLHFWCSYDISDLGYALLIESSLH